MPVAKLPTLPDPKAIQFWMGPDAHLLHYAIGGDAEYVNFFAVVEYPKVWPHADKWLDSIEPGEAAAAFEGWHPAVIEMVSQHLPVRWGLFGTRPLLHWYRGGVGHPWRRRARDAAAPRPRRQYHHRGRDHPGGTLARDGAGRARSDCSRNTSRCAAPGPAKSSAAPGSPMHCCICRMVRNSRNAIGGWRGSRRISAGSTSSTRSKRPGTQCRRSLTPLPAHA